MYLKSGNDYFLVNLQGISIICKSGLAILSPNIKIKLMSYPDINKVQMMEASGMKESDINEEICNKCVVSLLGFEEEEIDFDESPAGVIDHLATKIKLNSILIVNNIEESYGKMVVACSLYERLAMVVAYYTNNTYEFTQNLPIDELLKRYTLCSLSFRDVPPLESNVEEESKVG